ncbi:sensor histidine kinase [Paenibacillus dakarensis]|uniref:sensor histidine kinase n=1 Tax=Paenibacillus dakarensis TaxID=1527293 RepID=UPI0006D56F02|nr:HAMP domain-containing sensor histidine kinase [Paenibacillus dakarensis]
MVIGFFILLFVVLTPISIYLLVSQRENRLLIWGALIVLTGGMSGLQVILEKLALPYMQSAEVSNTWLTAAYVVTAFLNIVIHTFPYYLILLFFIQYAGYSQRVIIVVLLVPVLFSFVFCGMYPAAKMNYTYILSWGIPYLLASVVLFIKGLLQVEKGLVPKLQYFGVGGIFFVPVAFLLLMQLEGIYFKSPVDLLIFIPILSLISLLIGLILYVSQVFARFQSNTVLTRMQVATSMMQHAFKNAISKNKLYALSIQRSLGSKQYDAANEQLASLLKSNDHLLSMVSKLSYLTQSRISVNAEPTDLAELLDEVIEQYQLSFVIFEKQYEQAVVPMDRTLIAECLSNMISNAIEGMDGQGRITVTVEKMKRHTKVTLTDTGRGMNNEQLGKIFEPFYSTKIKSGHNFGLGMFHVKKIMNAHRGKVKVTSQPGKGTTVSLVLPI